ncbi:MAG: glycoside hydrolase family 99-like domain-containing protein [Methylovulum sp.]|nr:glycoside hydrolase family 99-like domain-containing protein [Methylovulum sp.]
MFQKIENLLINNQIGDALALAEQVVQRFSDNAEGYFLCAEIYAQKRMEDKSVEFLKRACDLDADSLKYQGRLAETLFRIGKIDASISQYQTVLEIEPVAWGYIGLGNAYEVLGDIAQTIANFQKAMHVDANMSTSSELLERLLSLQERTGDIKGAAESLHKLVTIMPEGRDDKYTQLCRLGQLYNLAKQYDQAVASYLSAMAVSSVQKEAYIGLAEVYYALKQPENEIKTLQQAAEICPDQDVSDRLIMLLEQGAVKKPKVIAYYLPQFHTIPENDKWWGEGFTEWTNVAAATPLFGGHLQPRRPMGLGYYDLRVPETVNKQFQLAEKYGIDAFCYYYYWFNGEKLLDKPLNDLMNGVTGPFPFCICWVNEEWTRSWDGMTGEVLMPLEHSPENDLNFIKDCLPILKHPSYVRINGKPMLLVYRADELADPQKTAQVWRDYCWVNGLDDIYLCAVQSFKFDDPVAVGFDAAVEFPPHALRDKHPDLDYYDAIEDKLQTYTDFYGKVYNYQYFAECAIKRPKEPYRLHRACMLAWDNTARRGSSAHIFHQFSVATYQAWLTENVKKSIQETPAPVVFINAWNEWAEGSVLEPDSFFGYELLEATRRAKRNGLYKSFLTYWAQDLPAFPDDRLTKQERILLVGHDACFNGAQINLMQMARCLRRSLGMDVVILLLAGGELLPEYEKIGKVIVLGSEIGWQKTALGHFDYYASLGTTKAICNTVVTGEVVDLLKGANYRVCSLVHELPALIAEYGLERHCSVLAEKADNLVFASSVVKDAFCEAYQVPDSKVLLAPQGIVFNAYQNQRETYHGLVRDELDLPADCKIVMGCGYADTRKGIDLFVQIAAKVCRALAKQTIAFVWVGALQEQLRSYIENDIKRLDLEAVFRVTGKVGDTARYYIASEVFALTSREDPFPSVVMEAFDAKLPVIAFEGGGGYVDIVGEQSGKLVPYLDVQAFADAVIELLSEDGKRQVIGNRNHDYCRAHFSYDAYMGKLLALLSGTAPAALSNPVGQRTSERLKISVVVPNYNYQQYLELRLRTLLDQSVTPDEIIVLDDASVDNSMEIINAIAEETQIPFKIIKNDVNSGNVFHQWELGINAAKGDLVWIAEADDYCEPRLLEKLVGYFADDQVVMAYTDSIMVDERGNSDGYPYKNYYASRHPDLWHHSFCMDGKALLKKCLLTENVVPNASAVVFRKTAVPNDLPTLKNYRFSGDWWFWIGIAEQGKVAYHAEPLNYHRRHDASVMGDVLKQGEKLLPETMAFYQRLVAQKRPLFDEDTLVQMNSWLETLYSYFPELLIEAKTLADHPRLGGLYAALQECLSSANATATKR